MSTLKTNRIEQVSSTDLPTNLLPVTASAWVSFNGTGTVNIRGSHNVESITDQGTGDYLINFTNDMDTTDYATLVTAGQTTATPICLVRNPALGSVRILIRDTSSSQQDDDGIGVIVFGGQS